ncbi:hypothetical protein F5Y01DRAFT_319589 [Xylaria sp. FL0043]|nr:hypothetical protein F5Y01DRAFT_319589 [Xylaria sp. FL0043]
MSSKPTNPILKVWYQWKSLRLPWRKRFFVGEFFKPSFSFPLPAPYTHLLRNRPMYIPDGRDAGQNNSTIPYHTIPYYTILTQPTRQRIGRDIQGNTYYELRQPRGDAPENAPYRRLVHYPRSTPYSEVKVPPAWHQWLRHQRLEAPTMTEQMAELQRQARIKLLAAEADARWAAKPSLLDMPPTKTAPPPTTSTTTETETTNQSPGTSERVSESGEQAQRATIKDGTEAKGKVQRAADTETETKPSQTKADTDPWKRAQRGAPGETWQPQAWTPTSAPARKR